MIPSDPTRRKPVAMGTRYSGYGTFCERAPATRPSFRRKPSIAMKVNTPPKMSRARTNSTVS